MSGRRWPRAAAVAALAVLLHLGLMTVSVHASVIEAPAADTAHVGSASESHRHVATFESKHERTGSDRRTGTHGARHHSMSAPAPAGAGAGHLPAAATSTGNETSGHPSPPGGHPDNECGSVLALARFGATGPVALESKAIAPATDLREDSGAIPNLPTGPPLLAPPGERRALLQVYRI
jgi:hypothetical protein